MSVSIPLWRLGRHTTSVVITPQSVTAAGVFSDGTAITCTAVLEELSLTYRANKEEINSANSTLDHMVVVSDGYQFRISIIEVNDTSDPSPLHPVVYTNDYFKVVYVHGTGASQKTVTLYGSRGDYEEGTRGRGKQIASFTLDSVDAGASSIGRA